MGDLNRTAEERAENENLCEVRCDSQREVGKTKGGQDLQAGHPEESRRCEPAKVCFLRASEKKGVAESPETYPNSQESGCYCHVDCKLK